MEYYRNNFYRASEKRNDKKYLLEAIQKHNTKFVIYKDCWPLTEKDGNHIRIVYLGYTEVEVLLKNILNGDLNNILEFWPDDMLFVGLFNCFTENEEACFAINLNDTLELTIQDLLTNRQYPKRYEEIELLLPDQWSLFSQTKAMFHWLDRYRFCATCGTKMVTKDAGYKRKCADESCRSNKGVHNTCYPRSDPTVIMNIESQDGKYCLLGRNKSWPKKMYSCLAGFVEPGETVEEAIVRETKEESGIDVGNISYVTSQAWPFPSSFMIGFTAVATSTDIKICEEEMEDVKWFTYEQVELALEGKSAQLVVPPKQAIAYDLMKHWVDSYKKDSKKSLL